MMLKKSFAIAFRGFAPGLMLALMLLLSPSSAQAQHQTQTQTTVATQQTPVAEKTATTAPATAKPVTEPLYRDYKGVRVGMSMNEVRQKLGKPEEKFDDMELFVFSDKERARIFYDKEKKARAISITYIGTNSGAPLPTAVLGTEIEGKEDGSMHKMVTYPEAGYWLSYSRTAGDNPLVMITMQKTP